MSTTNLKLEEIDLDDTINGTMLEKINKNMKRLDNKYGELKKALLEQTGKETLEEAISYVQTLANHVEFLNSSGDAVESNILSGKTAVVKGKVVKGTIPSQDAQTITPSTLNQTIATGQYLSGAQTIQGDVNLVAANILNGISIFGVDGSLKKQPTINVTLDSSSSTTYAGYISEYGAGINQNGTLVIWAMSSNTSYEHIDFVDTSIGIGTIGKGWNITDFDTGDPASVPHACTVTDLNDYDVINVTLKPTAVSASYDYIKVEVTITGE